MKRQGDPARRGTGKTALVVDDNASIRKTLVAAFLSDGFTACAQAADGKQGVELAKEIRPDIISLDLSMPVMNGLQAASQLRRIFPSTPIILFSLYAETLSARDASNAGVSVVLSKTAPLSALLDKAHELMGD